jgi:hypothetical protein
MKSDSWPGFRRTAIITWYKSTIIFSYCPSTLMSVKNPFVYCDFPFERIMISSFNMFKSNNTISMIFRANAMLVFVNVLLIFSMQCVIDPMPKISSKKCWHILKQLIIQFEKKWLISFFFLNLFSNKYSSFLRFLKSLY